MEIRRLKIFTANLEAQKDFYTKLFNFQVISQSETQLELYLSRSVLIFEEASTSTPYHFAFNVTKESEQLMLDFVKSKTNVLKFEDQEIIKLENWNADSVYFYDADKNLVELICRHRLSFVRNVDFTEKSLRQISEIGIASSDLAKTELLLKEKLQLETFDKREDFFAAYGDDSGLLIVVNPEKRKWFPTNDVVYASPFEAIVKIDEQQYNLIYTDGNLEIHELYSDN